MFGILVDMFTGKRKKQGAENGDNLGNLRKAAGFVVDLSREYEHIKEEERRGSSPEGKSGRVAPGKRWLAKGLFFLNPFFKKRKKQKEVSFAKEERGNFKRTKTEAREKLPQLTIFQTFKAIYYLCYGTGWITIFVIRFFWILGRRIFAPLLLCSAKAAKGATRYRNVIVFPNIISGLVGILNFFSERMEKGKAGLYHFFSRGGDVVCGAGSRSIGLGKSATRATRSKGLSILNLFYRAFLGAKNIYCSFFFRVRDVIAGFSSRSIELGQGFVRGVRSGGRSMSGFFQRALLGIKDICHSFFLWWRNSFSRGRDSIVAGIYTLKEKICFLWNQGKDKGAFYSKRFRKWWNKISDAEVEERILEKNRILEEISFHKKRLAKNLFSFALLAFLMILPFKAITYYNSLNIDEIKGDVLVSARAAAGDLQRASASISELNLGAAHANFEQAHINFTEAEKSVNKINGIILDLAKFLPREEAKLASEGKYFVEAGNQASQVGSKLTSAVEEITEADKGETMEAINGFHKHGEEALSELRALERTLKKIDTDSLPERYSKNINDLREEISRLAMLLEEAVNISEKLKIFLGEKRDKKYLLIFQNNTEMRATGGFLGSYALVEFSEGRIKDLEVPEGGSYDVKASMKEFYQAPEPLWLVDPLWHFWNGNWWPDWPTSAKNLMRMYSDSGGPTVDGVMSFTPTFLERILKVTGPIDMQEDYGVVFRADNCEENLRNIIEREAGHLDSSDSVPQEETDDPKKIIGDLMEELLENIEKEFDREKIAGLTETTFQSLKEEHILLYFDDEELQQEVKKRGWEGSIKETRKDYLSVINSNIAGKKSDKKIEQHIDHTASIRDNGSIVNEVKIKRSHTGDGSSPYYGARNVNWMRVYVPRGSELLNVEGFSSRPAETYFEEPLEEWEEHPLLKKQRESRRETEYKRVKIYDTQIYGAADKTVFAGWSILDPGEERVVTLKYKLPFTFSRDKKEELSDVITQRIMDPEQRELYSYSLYIQSQPGSMPGMSSVDSKVKFSEDYSSMWRYPATKEGDKNRYSNSLNADRYWAVLLEK